MLAHETYQVAGETELSKFEQWPLTRRLLQSDMNLFRGLPDDRVVCRDDDKGRQQRPKILKKAD